MADFDTYTLETAPDKSRSILETANEAYGFVPNLLGTMAEAPALAEAYIDIGKTFSKTSFNETEQQVVLLAVSRTNGCEYCVSAHTAIAKMGGVPDDVVNAVRDDDPISDPRLEALRKFTTTVVEKRGWLDDADLDDFLEAGFDRQQVLEVILGVAMKTMSNYTNHVAGTELDAAFGAAKWQAPQNRVA